MEILAFLNRSGEGSFHPDGINQFTLPDELNCQLFLSVWANLSPPIALGREIWGNSSKSYRRSWYAGYSQGIKFSHWIPASSWKFRYTLLHISSFTPIYILSCFYPRKDDVCISEAAFAWKECPSQRDWKELLTNTWVSKANIKEDSISSNTFLMKKC